jgi:hypothetical protein
MMSQVGEGRLLRWLAVVHTAVGASIYHRELGPPRRAGIRARLRFRGDRTTAFWFFVPSPLVWVIGGLVSDAEARGDHRALARAHRVSLASAAVAVAYLPVSGFWGWLAISARGLRRARADALGR